MPDALQELLDRAAIHAVLNRHCQGLDRLDEAVLASTYHPDAREQHGTFEGAAEEWWTGVFAKTEQVYERIRHTVSTVNAELEGDVAHVESSFAAECVLREPQDGEQVLKATYGRYLDRFERRAGEWRIARRTVVKDYGDVRAIHDPGPAGAFPLSEYGTADLLYQQHALDGKVR